MKLIYGAHHLLVPWALKRINGAAASDQAVAIGVERGGQIAGVFVFDEFSTGGCTLTYASDGRWGWLSRGVLYAVFAYPFIQCGFRRVTGIVSVSNPESLIMAWRLGARQEGLLREGGPDGEDMVIFGMLKSECKWIVHPPQNPLGIEGGHLYKRPIVSA